MLTWSLISLLVGGAGGAGGLDMASLMAQMQGGQGKQARAFVRSLADVYHQSLVLQVAALVVPVEWIWHR